MSESAKNIIANNKKALFDFFILEKFEAGIELRGAEVKSARARRVNIKDSFVRIVRSEAFLFNTHFSLLDTANSHFKSDETRTRRLLLHKKEINKLFGLASKKGYSIVPLKMYFNHKNILKVQIALVQGKKLHDKRESLKQKTLLKEAQMELKKAR